MRSLNIDPLRFINLCLSNGALTEKQVKEAVFAARNPTTALPINQHCAHARDEHGHLFSMFLATDKDTQGLRYSKDEKRVRFNLRSSQAPKNQQATQTPGAVLPQAQAGVPTLSPAQVQALQLILGDQAAAVAAPATVATATVPGTPGDEDFGDIDLG